MRARFKNVVSSGLSFRFGLLVLGTVVGVGLTAPAANAGLLVSFSDPNGLGAEAEFSLINGGNSMQIRLQNTSTASPFAGAASLLTGLSWDASAPGVNPGDVNITGGTIFTGPTSQSLNFSLGNVGPNTNVGGEWGWGNNNGTGMLPNLVSALSAGTQAAFGGPNLDGPAGLDGPQGGLAANPVAVPLGGTGAIQDEVIITVHLSSTVSELGTLLGNGVRIEFGSDAFFITTFEIPAPGAAAMLGLAAMLGHRRRRRN